MLPSFIQQTIPDNIKNKYPNLSRIIGVDGNLQDLSKDKNLLQLFNKYGYKNQTISQINYECPLHKYTGTKDIKITTMAKIQIQGGTISSDEAVPYIENNVFGNNFYSQFAGVRTIILTMSGQYVSSEQDITSIVDSIDTRIRKANALADSIVPNGTKEFTQKYNKINNSYNNIRGKINNYLNQAETISAMTKNIIQTAQSGDITNFLTNKGEQYEIARFIYSTILLAYSRIPIDIATTNINFPNMLLDTFNFEVPEGDNLQTLDFTLTWKHIPTYNQQNNISSALKSATKMNKSLGSVSGLRNAS